MGCNRRIVSISFHIFRQPVHIFLEGLCIISMSFDRQTPPAPRYDHTAAVHAERYLLVFGGCSHSIFFNDLHVLDLQTVSISNFIFLL